VAGTKESIHIVRLKTKGAEFEFRRQRYSATRLLIEMGTRRVKPQRHSAQVLAII
jgi:hypothetical protein